ncbi:hypothetical protein D3C78_841180 [compost metagenome]
MPPIQNGKPGFFRLPSAFWLPMLRSTKATEPTIRGLLSSPPVPSSPATRALPSLGTTVTAPGIGAIALPGSGTIAGIGVPATISPSGRARALAAGRPLRRANGWLWKPFVPCSETSRRVPSSNTSWTRHSDHMPWAKCG